MARIFSTVRANLFLAGIFVVAIYLLSAAVPKEVLKETLESFGALGPFILSLLLLATYVFAPLNSAPFLLAGFYLYGENIVFFSSIAAWISSVINFWIARRWGRPLVEKIVGIKNVKKIDKLAKNYGFIALFFLRIFHGALHDFISYAAGLTTIKFSRYFLATSLGMIPGTFLWYRLAIRANNPLEFISLTFVLILIFTATFFLSQQISRKIKK